MTGMDRIAVMAAAMVSSVAWAEIRYVDDDAGLGGSGQSWTSAYRYVQDALAEAAGDPGITEIRVAQGVYTPDRDEAGSVAPGDREASFHLRYGLAVRGGYAGVGASDPDERDIVQYESILSGNLLGDDGPEFEGNDDNSIHVVTNDASGGSATLDGVTVTAGNADTPGVTDQRTGAGVYNLAGGITLDHCHVTGNLAAEYGGGVRGLGSVVADQTTFSGNRGAWGGGLMVNGDALVTDSVFTGNMGGGGGIYNAGVLTVLRCDFVGNSYIDQGGSRHGGGLLDANQALVIGCRFAGNTAGRGGAVYAYLGDTTLINCLLHDNTGQNGSAIAIWHSAVLINCTLASNTDTYAGAAVAISSGMAEITNCILWGNVTEQIDVDASSPLSVTFSVVEGGWEGMGNIDADPLFTDPAAGDYRPALGSPCLDAGLCLALPPDATDLDQDGDTAEPIPYDLDGNDRITNTVVDLGAYELQGPLGPPGDIDGDLIVGVSDFLLLLAGWGPCCRGDLNHDGLIDMDDFYLVVDLIGPCPPIGPCPGDVDGDGDVDAADGLLVFNNQGVCAACPDDAGAVLSGLYEPCAADVNLDGLVDMADFFLLLANWGL